LLQKEYLDNKFMSSYYRFLYSLTIIYYFIVTGVIAQDFDVKFERIPSKQLQPKSLIFCIYQDQIGFLWIGTQNGLIRYNGYDFTKVKDVPIVSDFPVTAIIEDKSGVMWFGTLDRGLIRYDLNQKQFKQYLNDPNDPTSITSNRVLTIIKDKKGKLWIGTDYGINLFDNIGDKFFNYKNNPEKFNCLIGEEIKSIFEDRSDNIWIGTRSGLLKYNEMNNNLYRYRYVSGKSNCLSNNIVRTICEDRNGNIWIGTEGGGLNKLVIKDNKFIRPENNFRTRDFLRGYIKSTVIDENGNLWVGTLSGVYLLKKDSEKFINFKSVTLDPSTLSGDYINCIYEDNANNIWFGTLNGLCKFNRKKTKFKIYKNIPDNPNSIISDFVWSFYEDNSENLWVGTYGGLNMMKKKSEKFSRFNKGSAIAKSFSAKSITSIIEDGKGNLILGNTQSVICKFNVQKQEYLDYKNILSQNSVSYIMLYQDSDDNLWIGTYGDGLIMIGGVNKTYIQYKNIANDSLSLSDNKILAIFEDSYGNLWVGTDFGLNRFDKQKGVFIRYYSDNRKNSISSDCITSFCEDKTGNFWIGTFAGGLNKYDYKNSVFKNYTINDGLCDNNICGILCDDSGNLWISTHNGLSRLSPNTKEFRNYYEGDGLQGNKFNIGSCYKSKNGELFFGGNNGFNRFYPEKIEDNLHRPPVIINQFRKLGKETDFNGLYSEINEIELSYKDIFFSFEFAALDFVDPEKNQYAYKLEGFDRDWINSGNQRYANYTNIGGGDYIFKVKASNNDGIWNDKETLVRIFIEPPPWERWWAYVIYFLIFIGLIFGLVIYRTRRQQQKIKELEKHDEEMMLITKRSVLTQEEERHWVFRELHDGINQIITSVRIGIDKLISNSRISEPELGKLNKMRTYLDQVMHDIRVITHKLHPAVLDEYDLVYAVKDLLDDFADRTDITVSFNADNFKNRLPKKIEANVYRIIQEALQNAAKHSEASKINILMNYVNNQAIIKIKDNGKGFDVNSVLKTSIYKNNLGLSNMRERTRFMGGIFQIQSEPGKGTEISLKIPVNPDILDALD
jgi:ligand-binding sensor domain-containing protein/signal transduction histidine kinase